MASFWFNRWTDLLALASMILASSSFMSGIDGRQNLVALRAAQDDLASLRDDEHFHVRLGMTIRDYQDGAIQLASGQDE